MDDNGVFFMSGPGSQPFPNNQPLLIPDAPTCKYASVIDGASNTFLFGERYHYDPIFDDVLHENSSEPKARYPIKKYGAWGWIGGGNGTTHVLASTWVEAPLNYTCPPDTTDSWIFLDRRLNAFGSGHPAGANFTLTDGSVRFIAETIDMITYQALSTRAENEVIAGEF
jgi:hypothetical protein